ncbi:MAG: TetR/AcrR family transcriptional regulator [Clostridiales bacterium]|nr:TetR/AcrR family transcriptional regulator [Clostridiales bacterium]
MKDSDNPSAIRSRKVITDSLLELLNIFPYNEITVTQIIQNSDVARRTFYRNFTSKDDVIETYIRNIIMEYADSWEIHKYNSIDLIFDFVDKYKPFLVLLARNNMLHIFLTCLNNYLPEAHMNAAQEDPFRAFFGDLNPSYLLPFHIGGIWNTIFVWMNNGMKESQDDIRLTLKSYYSSFTVPSAK